MELKIQRLNSEKFGTHYGVFSGEKLIHIEFCRSEAEKFITALDSRFSAESLASKHKLSQEEANDLSKLLIDMAVMNFSFSHELSHYITINKLGHQYPNIAGIATMKDGYRQWSFPDGFSNPIYRIICKELNLRDKGTSARVIGFVSHKDMQC